MIGVDRETIGGYLMRLRPKRAPRKRRAKESLGSIIKKLEAELAMYRAASAIEFDHPTDESQTIRAEADLGDKWTIRDGEIMSCYHERDEAIAKAFKASRLK